MTQAIFQDASRAGMFYLPASRRPEAMAAAATAGLKLLEAAVGPAASLEALLQELGNALGFPDWYGANLDALYDCLTDPDWQPAPGHILLITGLDHARALDPEALPILMDVFHAAAEARRDEGNPLWILVDIPASDIPPLPSA